jgi:methionyl-tRNA formyltransferase
MGANLVVAGNQWITAYLVERLVEADASPSLLINLAPDRRAGISGYADLEPLAGAHGIPIYRPASYGLREEADRQALSSVPIDVLVVFGWQRLIPAWLIDHCRRGAFGVHGGPEKPPRCRGRAVFNWALVLGCSRFYVYLFQLTPEADAGRIVELTEFEITPDDDVTSLYHKNCVASGRMLLKHLPAILAGTVTTTSQPAGAPTYLPKRTPANSGICWDAPGARIANLIRASAPPYPPAFTQLEDTVVTILSGHPFDSMILFEGAVGTVVEDFPNGDFVVMAADCPFYVRRWEASPPRKIRRGMRFRTRSGEPPEDPVL